MKNGHHLESLNTFLWKKMFVSLFQFHLSLSLFAKFHCSLKENSERVQNHDDVIQWKHFTCYWPFVRGIHRSPVNSPHKGQWREALMFSLIWAWTNGWALSKQSLGWWFGTLPRSLWRRCNDCGVTSVVYKVNRNRFSVQFWDKFRKHSRKQRADPL